MASGIKIIWTDEMILFLKENYSKLTNRELANALGLALTITRLKLYELGLKKMEMEYWTDDQVNFLKQNYKTIGDVQIAEIFQSKFPKHKCWTNKHIRKKRVYLSLKRSPKEIENIRSKNAKPGGNAYTINKNSGIINLQDAFIASLIARNNPSLKEEILNHPQLLDLKRSQIKLRRAIKNVA